MAAKSWATARHSTDFRQVQNNEVLILVVQKESGHINWLSVAERRGLVVSLVALQRQDGQRARLMQAISREQGRKNGTHLLEAQRDFASFFVSGIGNDGEMRRMNLEPGRLGGPGGSAENATSKASNSGMERLRGIGCQRGKGVKEMLPRFGRTLWRAGAASGKPRRKRGFH